MRAKRECWTVEVIKNKVEREMERRIGRGGGSGRTVRVLGQRSSSEAGQNVI
jgi:hypothetical protein